MEKLLTHIPMFAADQSLKLVCTNKSLAKVLPEITPGAYLEDYLLPATSMITNTFEEIKTGVKATLHLTVKISGSTDRYNLSMEQSNGKVWGVLTPPEKDHTETKFKAFQLGQQASAENTAHFLGNALTAMNQDFERLISCNETLNNPGITSIVRSLRPKISKLNTIQRNLEDSFQGSSQREPFAIDECIKSIIHRYRPVADGLKIDLKQGPMPNIDVDASRYRVQSFLEDYIRGSFRQLKSTEKETNLELFIGLINTPKNVSILIRDNGPGLTNDQLENIFSQDSNHILSKVLHIAAAQFQAIGGRIQISSEGKDKGTGLLVALPKHTGARNENTNCR